MAKPIAKVIIVHGILCLLFGIKVALIGFLIYLCIPFLLLFHKARCYVLYMPKLRWPFLDHSNIKSFGIDGGRHFMLKYQSTVAKQELELGVWHLLPRNLCETVNSMSLRSEEEITTFFINQLKDSGNPIFLYCHGISHTRGNAHRTKLYQIMQDLEAHVITFDYRGFADSTDVMPTKIGLVEDSLAVYAWLKGVSGDSPVFIWGHSMGGGVVNKLLSKLEDYSCSLLQLEKPLPLPAGAVIEASYDHIINGILYFEPFDFLNILPHYRALIRTTYDWDDDVRLDSVKYVKNVTSVPYLMLHSKDDNIVLFKFGLDLYNAVKSARTENDALVTFEEFDGHGHMWMCNDERLPKIVGDFIYAHRKGA